MGFFTKWISETHLKSHRQHYLCQHKSGEAVVFLPGKSHCSIFSYSKREKDLRSGLCFQLISRSIHFQSQEASFAMSSDLHWVNCVNFFNSCSFRLVGSIHCVPVCWWVGLDATISHQLGVCLPFRSHLIRALCLGIVCLGVNQCKQLIAAS